MGLVITSYTHVVKTSMEEGKSSLSAREVEKALGAIQYLSSIKLPREGESSRSVVPSGSGSGSSVPAAASGGSGSSVPTEDSGGSSVEGRS